MSQRTAVTASTEKAIADQSAARVQPERRGEKLTLAQNLLHLQQAVGNRTTQGLLSTGLLQAKLRIGAAGDRFEREADRMADTVMRMPEPGIVANATQVAQARSDNVQRVCSECEEDLRRQPMEEDEEELLQAKSSTNVSPTVNAGVESCIASLHGGGRPLSPVQRSFFEPRFNHDFSNVRVHTGGTATESACAIKARAFTVGRDIAFGTGQYAPESRSGRRLLAHELTHTIQQTPLVARRKPLIQRQPETSPDVDSALDQTESESPFGGPIEQPEQTPAGPEPGPETPVPGETPAPGLIVGDETSELGPGQMGKRAFLAELRSGICAAADEPLAGTQYTAQGCPTIELYLRIYEGFSAERIEQDLVRFMPEAAGITDARQYIPLMAARVQRSVAVWVQTGEITGVPEGLPTGLPGLGAIARILFKARSGGPRGNPNPQAVQAQLGAGRPINSSVGSRMGSAFGRSFSDVRVHTDSSAAQLSNRFNARAFTVGNHVAFGSGEYRPGTLMGDALIAHELAHTVQQGGENESVASMQPGSTATTALEKDADRSAVGAVASIWGETKGELANIVQNTIPQLRSGLRLQRCNRKKAEPAPEVINCCCCVDDVKIDNISKYTSGNLYGHRFDLIADLEHKEAKKKSSRDCNLKWEEKTNRVYHHAMKANAWNDMFSLLPLSPTFDPWTKGRKKICPGKETVTINDPPAASVKLPARTLEFRIAVGSASDCDCANTSKTVTATQLLEPDGKGGIKTQEFTTP